MYVFLTVYVVIILPQDIINYIGGVMVSVLASSVVDRWFKAQLGQTKVYEIGICFFSNIKEKEQRLVGSESGYEWEDMSIHVLVSVC